MYKFLSKFKLLFKPIKKGRLLYGNPISFVIARPVEYVLHGLRNKTGQLIFDPIPNNECYKLTVLNEQNDYFECESQVFCRVLDQMYVTNNLGCEWKVRTQNKKIDKKLLKNLFAEGLLRYV